VAESFPLCQPLLDLLAMKFPEAALASAGNDTALGDHAPANHLGNPGRGAAEALGDIVAADNGSRSRYDVVRELGSAVVQGLQGQSDSFADLSLALNGLRLLLDRESDLVKPVE